MRVPAYGGEMFRRHSRRSCEGSLRSLGCGQGYLAPKSSVGLKVRLDQRVVRAAVMLPIGGDITEPGTAQALAKAESTSASRAVS